METKKKQFKMPHTFVIIGIIIGKALGNWQRIDAEGNSIAVVPLTIPLLTGPAAMSTVVIYADRAQTFWQHAALVGYGVVIAAATAVCFSLAEPIARVLGKTGINVMTRLMGLILAALAVEVMAEGLVKLFPVLK